MHKFSTPKMPNVGSVSHDGGLANILSDAEGLGFSLEDLAHGFDALLATTIDEPDVPVWVKRNIRSALATAGAIKEKARAVTELIADASMSSRRVDSPPSLVLPFRCEHDDMVAFTDALLDHLRVLEVLCMAAMSNDGVQDVWPRTAGLSARGGSGQHEPAARCDVQVPQSRNWSPDPPQRWGDRGRRSMTAPASSDPVPQGAGSRSRQRRLAIVPARDQVDDDTPMLLAIVAALAFPDQSMSARALQGEIDRGRLVGEKIGGRWYTTLGHIRRMRGTMPRKSKGPRLYRRERKGRPTVWGHP